MLRAIPALLEYQKLSSFPRDAGIRWTGGQSQLLSVLQFCAKASTPKQSGKKNFELNLETWLFSVFT